MRLIQSDLNDTFNEMIQTFYFLDKTFAGKSAKSARKVLSLHMNYALYVRVRN